MKDLFGKFKEYKNILGKPGTGVHKLKFKGTSLFDYFLTIASAFFITSPSEFLKVILGFKSEFLD